jgi:DNA-directed RNA polymerase subunit RPC12/RpoP
MSRKPQRRPRGSASRSPRTPTPERRGRPQMFWQCMACGAPADPRYGKGDESWCPSCRTCGNVMGMEGQLPSPHLYGVWLAQQERKERERLDRAAVNEFLKSYTSKKEEDRMKTKKTHTGTYHCPRCFIELELIAEESLKCDQCQGPLAAGSLDDLWDDEPDDVDD